MPIRQYLYFDAIECLPERVLSTYEYERDLPTEKSRYYSQEIIFGKDFQHRLGEAKYFVVRFHIT
jgi:ubiquitin-activating enzyme E1